MAKKSKDTKMEEEMCEGCGSDYSHSSKKMKKESVSKSKRMTMQDEYDMEKEEEMEEMKEEETEMEEEDSMKEGYSKKSMSEEEMDMEDEEDEEEEEEMEMEESVKIPDMKESIEQIFSGQDLSEEFKLKVSTLFEAAVNDRVKLVEEQLAEKFTNLLESEVEEIANDLTEKVDSYLNYVVSEWMEENKLAVERGIRTDVAESFIAGLKNLFNEHNISVPEGQTDLLDETANNLEKVTEQLNAQIKKTLDLTEQLKKYQRAEIFAEATEGLSSVQTEKLRQLAESMKFADNSEFKAKLLILKENYGKSEPKPTVSSIQVEDTSEPTVLNESSNPEISAYLQALLRKNK